MEIQDYTEVLCRERCLYAAKRRTLYLFHTYPFFCCASIYKSIVITDLFCAFAYVRAFRLLLESTSPN